MHRQLHPTRRLLSFAADKDRTENRVRRELASANDDDDDGGDDDNTTLRLAGAARPANFRDCDRLEGVKSNLAPFRERGISRGGSQPIAHCRTRRAAD